MMDILQRLQEGQEDDEELMRQLAGMGGDAGAEEEEEEEDELARTLAGVDLGAFRTALSVRASQRSVERYSMAG